MTVYKILSQTTTLPSSTRKYEDPFSRSTQKPQARKLVYNAGEFCFGTFRMIEVQSFSVRILKKPGIHIVHLKVL